MIEHTLLIQPSFVILSKPAWRRRWRFAQDDKADFEATSSVGRGEFLTLHEKITLHQTPATQLY